MPRRLELVGPRHVKASYGRKRLGRSRTYHLTHGGEARAYACTCHTPGSVLSSTPRSGAARLGRAVAAYASPGASSTR
jgi:hypothetical protein